MTPGCEIERRAFVEHLNKVEPGRISKLELLEICGKAVLKLLGSENALELAHHDRRLLINDCAIQTPRFIEVRELLANRIRARSSIHGVCGGIVGDEKSQAVIDLRKRGIHDL